MGTCGSYTYSAKLISGLDLPSFISFDSLTRTFTVETSNTAHIGTYNLVVKG